MQRITHKITIACVSALFGAIHCLPLAIAHAQANVSETTLFYRCYGHLTQMRPARTDALLADVRAGRKTAIQACTEVLDRARLTANAGTTIQDPNDTTAKKVLYSMYQLHRSWAREQVLFNPTGAETLLASEPWFDDSPYGAFVTRSLFSANHPVHSITQGNEFVQAVRTTMNPPKVYNGVPSTVATREKAFRLGDQHPFAPRGEPIGMRAVSIAPINWTRFGDLLGSMPEFTTLQSAPSETRALTEINFQSASELQGNLTESVQYAIWIQGQIQIPQAGSYTFYLDVDDAGMLYLDGTRVLDKTISATRGSEGSVTRTMTAGAHALELRYAQRSGAGKFIFRWEGPGISKQVVPASALSGLQARSYLHGNPQKVELTGSEGGGFIGNHNYLLTTFTEPDPRYTPNGAELTNRSWARAVLHDALCRDLPAVREADAEMFANPDSAVPFRQVAGCTTCHASIDRQAGVIRGLRWSILATVGNDPPVPDWYGLLGVRMLVPTAPLATDWPDSADPNYGARPAYGHLYFRNYKGELVDRVIQSVEQLGAAIREQDDHYLCFAKRYYEYFLGISVDLGDPGDPSYRSPNKADAYHRAKVIDIGLRLKQHGSLRQVILDILGSAEYRKSDYGVSYSG
jgi:hypothetical protein